MIWKTLILLGLAAFVAGDGHATSEQKVIIRSKPQHGNHGDLNYGSDKHEHREEYAWSYPAYEFYYKVDDPHTRDKKGQKESREGNVVKGEYWLYEPDGRKRTVEYYADEKSGFKAIVKYSSPHKHEYPKQKDEDHQEDHYDDHHDDEHKKDDHKDSHEDEHRQDDYKDHDDNDYDDKRGHSSQIMPYLEEYRPFPNRQASIKYDVPYPQQKYYIRNRKQY